jgi:uncharacterized protein (TIGR03545 family)
MKIFHWQGVLAFALLGGLVGAFLILFLDGMIERGIEEKGSEAAKTQIDIGSLATSLLAQSVALSGIEVANPDNNMENLVQFEKLSLDLDGPKIISRKIIIDELQAHGIKLNQKRTQPAQVPAGVESTQKAGQEAGSSDQKGLALPGLGGLSIKSPEEILKSEKLETLEAGNRAKKIIDDLKAKWQKKFDTDLNPNAIKETQQKLAALQEKVKGGDLTEIPKALQEFESLQKDIQDRMNRITSMKSELQKDIQMAKQKESATKRFSTIEKQIFAESRRRKKHSRLNAGGSVKRKTRQSLESLPNDQPLFEQGQRFIPC